MHKSMSYLWMVPFHCPPDWHCATDVTFVEETWKLFTIDWNIWHINTLKYLNNRYCTTESCLFSALQVQSFFPHNIVQSLVGSRRTFCGLWTWKQTNGQGTLEVTSSTARMPCQNSLACLPVPLSGFWKGRDFMISELEWGAICGSNYCSVSGRHFPPYKGEEEILVNSLHSLQPSPRPPYMLRPEGPPTLRSWFSILWGGCSRKRGLGKLHLLLLLLRHLWYLDSVIVIIKAFRWNSCCWHFMLQESVFWNAAVGLLPY